MQIHLVIAACALLLAIFLPVSRLELMIIIFLIGIVLSAEAMNTAIERTVDLVVQDYHPLAKAAKDIAAAAVFVLSLMAVIIGIIIFYPPLIQVIKHMI